MYHSFFGLRESPFGLTPDPRYLFLTDAHKEALASVIYGLQERKGFVLILGEVGTGKTTVIRHILGRLGTGTKAAFVFNPAIGFDELLRVVLRELEVPCTSRLRADMVETLHRFLLDEAVAGRVVALIIDEAQHLSSSVLEELRMLSNLETTRSKLLQIVLVGQPELGAMLARPGLRQVRQRIGLVAELRPLTWPETVQYVRHRLEVAGGDQRQLFTRAALRRIYRESSGIPRIINVVCDKTLILAYGAGRQRVTRRIVRTAVKEWRAFDRASTPQRAGPLRRAAVASRARRSPTVRLSRIAAAMLLSFGGAALLLAATHSSLPWRGLASAPAAATPQPVLVPPRAPNAAAALPPVTVGAVPAGSQVPPLPAERAPGWQPRHPDPVTESTSQVPEPLALPEVPARALQPERGVPAGPQVAPVPAERTPGRAPRRPGRITGATPPLPEPLTLPDAPPSILLPPPPPPTPPVGPGAGPGGKGARARQGRVEANA